MSTAPDEDARAAFKAILDDAHLTGVIVYPQRPEPGFELRSVIMTQISEVSGKPGIGLWVGDGEKAFEERMRLQLDCFYDDPEIVGRLANQVVQAILDNRDLLEANYNISNLGIAGNRDVAQEDPNDRVWQRSIDVVFTMNRLVS